MYCQIVWYKNVSVYYLQEIISTSKIPLRKELKYFFALISTTNTEINLYNMHFIHMKNGRMFNLLMKEEFTEELSVQQILVRLYLLYTIINA